MWLEKLIKENFYDCCKSWYLGYYPGKHCLMWYKQVLHWSLQYRLKTGVMLKHGLLLTGDFLMFTKATVNWLSPNCYKSFSGVYDTCPVIINAYLCAPGEPSLCCKPNESENYEICVKLYSEVTLVFIIRKTAKLLIRFINFKRDLTLIR